MKGLRGANMDFSQANNMVNTSRSSLHIIIIPLSATRTA